jgi:rare lipoprotein A (peptidoglycan hydrolase)
MRIDCNKTTTLLAMRTPIKKSGTPDASLDAALDRRVTARTCHQHALHRPTTTSLVQKRLTAPLFLIGVLIAGMACVIAPAGSALASTGGAGGSSAPSSSAPRPPAPAKVHTTGIATWFGPGFYGQKTACGQTLTPGVVGVANRTLPCGTLVQVSYKGHTLTVPVLDRGPYSNIGANWDLTAGAAGALGIEDTVRIGTRVVGSTPNTPTLGAPAQSLAESATGGAAAS